jgi:hypothetical protein
MTMHGKGLCCQCFENNMKPYLMDALPPPYSAINPKIGSVPTSLTVDSLRQITIFAFTKNVQFDYDWSLCLRYPSAVYTQIIVLLLTIKIIIYEYYTMVFG